MLLSAQGGYTGWKTQGALLNKQGATLSNDYTTEFPALGKNCSNKSKAVSGQTICNSTPLIARNTNKGTDTNCSAGYKKSQNRSTSQDRKRTYANTFPKRDHTLERILDVPTKNLVKKNVFQKWLKKMASEFQSSVKKTSYLFQMMGKLKAIIKEEQGGVCLKELAKDKTFQEAYFLAMKKHLFAFQRRTDYSYTLHSLATIQLYPGKEWMENFLQYTESKLQNLYAHNLSDILCALAKLQHKPKEIWLSKFWVTCYKNFSHFEIPTIVNTLWASAFLKITPHKDWLRGVQSNLWIAAQTSQKKVELVPYYHQLHTVNHYHKLPDGILPENVQEHLKSQPAEGVSSRLHKKVVRHLSTLFPDKKLCNKHWIDVTATPVDIFMPQQKLVIQVDGPYHFLSDGRLNGSSQFQKRLLEEHGKL